MTGERFVVKGNWIEDRCIGKLLNIDFNTNADAVLCCDLLNNIENKKLENGRIATKLLEENEQLKKENKELRQDNDIKFWKLQYLQSSNNNQVMLFELSRVIQQGYEVSDKFKQYLDEIKEHNKEIQEKHKRLFE